MVGRGQRAARDENWVRSLRDEATRHLYISGGTNFGLCPYSSRLVSLLPYLPPFDLARDLISSLHSQ
jgi:hypothetical protein